MSQLEIEDETRPCKFEWCPGRMSADLDGNCVVWTCGVCQTEDFQVLTADEDTCAAGLPIALQRGEPPAGPVFLGPAIPRRP